jgi:hypothetical protein
VVLLTRAQLYRIKRALNIVSSIHMGRPLIPKPTPGELQPTVDLVRELERIERETDGECGEKLKAKPG